MDPVSLAILPALSIHTSDFRHRQRETRERKEFHLQSAFQVPRVIQGVIPKATLFQLHKHPNVCDGRGGPSFSIGSRD